jgi:hypothetical protein
LQGGGHPNLARTGKLKFPSNRGKAIAFHKPEWFCPIVFDKPARSATHGAKRDEIRLWEPNSPLASRAYCKRCDGLRVDEAQYIGQSIIWSILDDHDRNSDAEGWIVSVIYRITASGTTTNRRRQVITWMAGLSRPTAQQLPSQRREHIESWFR